MTRWLDDLRGELREGNACIAVTVLTVEGSAPREPGARMIVTDTGLHGTIGGGRLEFEAIDAARARLAVAPEAWTKRFPLGPELGQCCGGVVTVLFEPFSTADEAWVRQLHTCTEGPATALRIVELRSEGSFLRTCLRENEVLTSDDPWIVNQTGAMFDAASDGVAVRLEDGACTLIEKLDDTRQPVWLFGAGHVGRAVARALAPLPFKVTWIDSRADAFPAEMPKGVLPLTSAMPAYLVEEAPPGAFYLVMTHSHALDQELCEAVLRRRDDAYLGLIGSATKAARFASRLKAKTFEQDQIARIHCPIGVPGIEGKQPEIIAASVAADLLMKLEEVRSGREQNIRIGGSVNV